MDCTNCGEKCAYVVNGFCKTDADCPHYIESWWTNEKEAQPKLVKDCFPKRASIQQSQTTHRVFVLQEATEQLRNEVNGLKQAICQLINQNNAICAEVRPTSANMAIENQKIGEIE